MSQNNRLSSGWVRLRLRVHERDAQVLPVECGISWPGFVIYPGYRRVRGRKVLEATRRLNRRYDAWRCGEIRFGEFDASVQGWINHVRYADSWSLRGHLLSNFDLSRRSMAVLR